MMQAQAVNTELRKHLVTKISLSLGVRVQNGYFKERPANSSLRSAVRMLERVHAIPSPRASSVRVRTVLIQHNRQDPHIDPLGRKC